jgi:arginine-tRNA-protein transferase
MKEEPGEQQFFITPAHPCSYLERRNARTLFLDPRETISQETYQSLTEQGFRRSGSHLYRPHCKSCQACIPTRIPVRQFEPSRSQRRILRRNRDLEVRLESASYSHQHYDLYERYINGRHMDGDMYPPSQDQFRSFLLSQWSDTLFLSTYQGDRLVSAAVTDRQPNGLSAIYTFFDPEQARRSPGIFSVLQQINLCAELGMPHLYLGYWIKDSQKMSYKTDYRPVELLANGRWVGIS